MRRNETALESAAAPIVLLRRTAGDPFPLVAPGSPCLGVMLPASPLHHLLVGGLRPPPGGHQWKPQW